MPTNSLENMTTEQLQESTRLLHTLLGSPDTRETTLRMIAKKTGQTIPEITSKDDIAAQMGKMREENQALAARIQEREILERIEKERAKVKKDHALTDEDVSAVEKLMVDKDAPIPSYAAAAKVYVASKQVAQPTSSTLQDKTWQMPEKDVWAGGIGNRMELDKIANREAYKALNEFRQNAKVA